MHPELKETASEIVLLRQALHRESYEFFPQFVTNFSVGQKIGRVRRLLGEAIIKEQASTDSRSNRFELEQQLEHLEKFETKNIQGREDVDRMKEAGRQCLCRLIADLALAMGMDRLEPDASIERIVGCALEFLSGMENRFTVEAGLQNFREDYPSAVTEKNVPLLMKMAADLLRKEVPIEY
jgi:hypothetical protein